MSVIVSKSQKAAARILRKSGRIDLDSTENARKSCAGESVFSLTPTKLPRKVHLSAHFRYTRDAPQEFSHFQFKLNKLVLVIHGGEGGAPGMRGIFG